MIVDYLKNVSLYEGMNNNLKKISEFVKTHNLETLEKGKYDLGDECFVNILESEPKESERFEAHKKYIDVQYIVLGSEKIYWQNLAFVDKTTEYDEVKDRFFSTAKEYESVTVKKGMFMLLLPDDAHCPGIPSGDSFVKKAVFKIKI